jgi:hypothetical protein
MYQLFVIGAADIDISGTLCADGRWAADDADMNVDLQNAKIGQTARPSFNQPNIDVLLC